MNTWKTRQVAGCAEQLIWKGFKYELQTEVAQRGRCQVNGSAGQSQMWTFECSTFNNNLCIQNVFI